MPKIGSAPDGERATIDGTEKVPLGNSADTLSWWAYISTIAEYIRTLTQILTNKTLTSPTITGSVNAAVYEGDVVTSDGEIVWT